MKRLSLVINIVLVLAVAGLYVLYFVSGKQSGSASNRDTTAVFNPGDLKIAYVKIDTLISHYAKADVLTKQLTDKEAKFQSELNTKLQAHQNKVTDFQNKVQKGLLLRSEAEQMQQQLIMAEQDLQKLNNDLSQQLGEEQAVMTRQIYEDIVQFLAEYNQDHNYTYIFAETYPGNLLFAHKGLDITADVIEKINAKYEKEEKKK
ncbi:MAG: OmpH family outer membrane protein [Bacteroidales bacterium]